MYQEIIERVKNGASFSVDFKNRKMKLNGKQVLIDPNNLGIEKYENLDEWLDKVEDLYDDYKYSRPTKTTMGNENKVKFRALSMSELIDEFGHDALSNPIGRNEAQAALEVFILFSLLNGSFDPEELFKKDWFFQGTDKQLIIRKDWF